MERRFEFTGTGGGLFVKFFVGMLLTMITFGIYAPWFAVSIWNYIADNTTMSPTERGTLRFRFTGTGGELFVIGIVGYLLTLITLGIYLPWFMIKLTQYFCQNASAKAEDGTIYRVRFNGTGGDLFIKFIIGYLLSLITFGIYVPWFMCSIQKFFATRTTIHCAGEKVGGFDFVGTGGDLFVTYLVGFLLTMITLGIYQFWFQVKLTVFFAENTRVTVEGETLSGAFHGTGGQLFVKVLVGGLLTSITLGIYGAWLMVDLLKFQLHNLSFSPTHSTT